MLENINDLLLVSQAQETQEPYNEITQWVATDFTQYIDTGFIADQNSKIEIGFNILDTGTAVRAIFGSRNWNGSVVSQAFYFYKINGTTVQVGWGNQSKNIALGTTTASTEITSPMRLIIDKGSVTLVTSANTYTETFTSTTFETSTSLVIGTSRTGTSGTELDNRPASVDVRYCRLWNNGTLAYNYYPALDNKIQPCLYDKVTKTFAYAKKISDGTTTYDLGFKRWNKYNVDYIENTGTAYIPFADITPSATMGMNIEYAYTVLSASEPAGVIGTYNGDTQRKDTFFVSTSSGSTQKASSPSSASCGVMVFHRGGNVGTSSATSLNYIEPEKDVWYTATVNWLGDGEINWTDGTNELSTSVGANSVMTNQLRLFSRCNSSNNTYNNCKCRVRKLQFSDGSNIIRDYKPVVWHNSDTTAIATLYDEVYNKMATPNGSLKAYITNDKKMELMSYIEGNTHGYYISATGVVTAQSESDYTDAIAVQQGDIVTLTTSTTSRVSNKRIHGYNGTSTNDWVQQLGYIAYSEEGGDTRTISVVVPSGVTYIRVSHSIYGETQCDLTIVRTYEVGSNCFVTPTTASQQVTNNYFNTGMYGNEKWNVKLIVFTSTNVAGQLFGNFVSSSVTNNLTINSGTATGTGTISRFDGQAMSQDKIINMGINQKSLLQINKIGAWQDSTQIVAWSNPNSFTTSGTCYLCGTNGSATVRPNGCCYLAIEEDNVLIAEFIPVRNATVTSEYGLYDRINGALNTGIGTITFNTLS